MIERTLTSGEIKAANGMSYAALYRLYQGGAIGRDKVHGSYVYNLREVNAAVKKRDAAKTARQFAQVGKPRKIGRGGRRTRNDFSSGNGRTPVNVKVEPDAQRKPSGERYYPKAGDKAILIFAERSGSLGAVTIE